MIDEEERLPDPILVAIGGVTIALGRMYDQIKALMAERDALRRELEELRARSS